MEINYELTKEDFIQFNMYHYKNSKVMKKSLIFMRYFLPIFFIVAAIVTFVLRQEIAISSIIFVIVGCLWFVLFPGIMNKSIYKKVDQFFSEGKNLSLLGKHSIVINEESIIEKSETSEVKHSWATVEKVAESETHIIIYVSAVSAYMIPIKAFNNDEEKSKFIDLVRNYNHKK